MLELSAPAVSPEAVRAAVSNGADAVCLGFSVFNTGRSLGSFNEDEFSAASEYCKIRGVRIYANIDSLILDNEFEAALSLLNTVASLGADAAVVSDIGFLKTVKQLMPDFELHAGGNMGIHSLEGVLQAAEAGASRAVLAKELSHDEISYICLLSPIDIEVCAFGQPCVSYSGLCYMSSFNNGKEKANRTSCSRPCRESFGFGSKADSYPLCLKKVSLGQHLNELERSGVRSIRLCADNKRPEYIAMATDIFSRSIKRKRPPGEHDMKLLTDTFPCAGYTDGYFTKKTGAPMFGRVKETQKHYSPVLTSVKADYMGAEPQRVPVSFYGLILRGMPARLAAQDENGNTVRISGPVPGTSGARELSHVLLQTQLYKTSGTPYYCTGVKSIIDKNLYMDTADINKMRSELLTELSLKRRSKRALRQIEYRPGFKHINSETEPELTVSVLKAEQLSPELAGLKPKILYVPLKELFKSPSSVTPFWENNVTAICAVLPPVIHDDELQKILRSLKKLKDIHIEEVLINNIGHITPVKKLGFTVRGDYGLNIFNSNSLKHFKDMGLSSCTLSFELKLSNIKDISKCIDTECIVYGRVPLMLTENCLIRSSGGVCTGEISAGDTSSGHPACEKAAHIIDRNGSVYPISGFIGCRNIIYSANKIFLADKQREYTKVGLWGARLNFTTENEKECVQVARRYLSLGSYEPAARTRGNY